MRLIRSQKKESVEEPLVWTGNPEILSHIT